eukprot:sb/3461668/
MEFQNLQSLLNRATAPNSEEEAKHYCTRFTTLVNQEPDGASRAITLLIAKVQSQNEPVALRAIHVMDQCGKLCGKPFQAQIGKFRFLNELIKLVSVKYAGNQTPVAVRSAIVQQLKLWSRVYKDQPKIQEAFNMLEKTGNTNIQTAPKKDFTYAVGEDADKAALLSQLLKSKSKADLETANKMIKDMVAAEGRKVELDAELLKDVALIHNNGRLLSEMLANEDTKSEEEQLLLDELHKTCVGLRPKLYRLAGQLSDSAQLSSVVEAGETLNKAIEQYEMMMGARRAGSGAPPQLGGYQAPTAPFTAAAAAPAADLESTTLINLDEGEPSSQTMSAADFDDFLSSVTTSTTSPAAVVAPVEAQVVAPAPATNGEVSSMGGLFGGMTLQPQHPVSLMQQPPQQATPPPPTDFSDALGLFSEPLTTSNPAPAAPVSGNLLDDLFGLGGTGGGGGLLEPTLQPTVQPAIPVTTNSQVEETSADTFDFLMPNLGGASFTKPKAAPTLAELQSKPAEPVAPVQPSTVPAVQPTATVQPSTTMEPLIPGFSEPAAAAAPEVSHDIFAAPPPPARDELEDVEVPLTLIRPCPVPPLLVLDSPITRVQLYSTENKPVPGVVVWLATITNSAPTSVTEVTIEVRGVDGRVKLAAPSSRQLSPFSPICPASPIQQVVLTTDATTGLSFNITYVFNGVQESKSGQVTLTTMTEAGPIQILRMACNKKTEWEKDEFLDSVYWIRQIIAIVFGVVWGVIKFKGIFGILIYVLLNLGIIFFYYSSYHEVDEEEYGGHGELAKEGLLTSFSLFLVFWIILYTLYMQSVVSVALSETPLFNDTEYRRGDGEVKKKKRETSHISQVGIILIKIDRYAPMAGHAECSVGTMWERCASPQLNRKWRLSETPLFNDTEYRRGDGEVKKKKREPSHISQVGIILIKIDRYGNTHSHTVPTYIVPSYRRGRTDKIHSTRTTTTGGKNIVHVDNTCQT